MMRRAILVGVLATGSRSWPPSLHRLNGPWGSGLAQRSRQGTSPISVTAMAPAPDGRSMPISAAPSTRMCPYWERGPTGATGTRLRETRQTSSGWAGRSCMGSAMGMGRPHLYSVGAESSAISSVLTSGTARQTGKGMSSAALDSVSRSETSWVSLRDHTSTASTRRHTSELALESVSL